LTNTQARVLLRLIPSFGEDFPHYNVSYLSKVLGLNHGYVQEILDFLYDKDIVSLDGEDYYLSQDNIWKIEGVVNRQSMIALYNKIKDMSD
jgi:hypothetical protein